MRAAEDAARLAKAYDDAGTQLRIAESHAKVRLQEQHQELEGRFFELRKQQLQASIRFCACLLAAAMLLHLCYGAGATALTSSI